jgi:acetyl esterase/lipase
MRKPPLVARLLALIALCLAFAPVARAADKQPPDDVEFSKDVVYGKGGGKDLKLDLSRPKQANGKRPCIVVFHGGGWAAGNKDQHDDVTWMLAQRGYVAATVGYRFAPEHVFPAQVEDAKCAVRFLRAHADKYGIDSERIGAVGFSAGAHLSMMLGTTRKEDGLEGTGGWADQSSRVQAVVSFFGPTDLAAPDLPQATLPILKKFLGGTKEEKPDAYKRASPITYVRKDCPPMLLFQGTMDPLVPHTQAYRMADAMTKAGVDGRVELLIGLGHGWVGPELRRTADAAFTFFDNRLSNGKPPNAASAPHEEAGAGK